MAAHAVKLWQHVTYYDVSRKPRPGTIVNITSQSVVDIRIAGARNVISNVSKNVSGRSANSWHHK